MKKIFKSLLLSAIAMFVVVGVVFAVANFFNGFEIDTSGWFTDGSTITRVASGYNGIASADGSYHAEVQASAYTRWGGYENPFPANGYVTKVDVYLDMAENPTIGTDKRFDFSSAINKPDGSHRRDFIFNVGTDPLVAGQFAMSASNNAPGWPSNPGRNPLFVTQTGWYTFRHTFQDNGSGILEVVMVVLDSNGTVLRSWTLSDPTDVIGTTVGGNRYGWFVTSAFNTLAVDNSEKINVVVDNEAPDVKIESPTDGSVLSGTVHIFGTVTDDNPHHYWLVIQNSSNITVAGPGVVNDTNSFTNQDLLVWNTTILPDGTYTIKLEARDAFNNKDSGSVDWNVVTVDNTPPLVEISSPSDDSVISGLVDITGSVTDNFKLSHYNLSLYPGDVDLSDGDTHSGDRLNNSDWCTTPMSGTVYLSANFTGNLCAGWDTTKFTDSDYQIRLAARDAAGNRDLSDPYTGNSSSVHVIKITINNTPDNKDQCKNGGWMSFYSPIFKNQGDCVSYIQSNDNAVGNKEK